MTALFPGSFDPATLGHVNIAERAARLCDTLIVAVLDNPSKRPLFTAEERVALLAESVRHIANARVDAFAGLTAEYAKRVKAETLIRGVRSAADYAYEAQMAQVNRMLSSGLETVLLIADPVYAALSSSVARELAAYGPYRETLERMVPRAVARALQDKYM